MIGTIPRLFVYLGLLAAAGSASAAVYDLKTDWSDAANANGVWTYREGNNALPHVASWQSSLGGYTSPQPGWAASENGNPRIPFWSNPNNRISLNHQTNHATNVLRHPILLLLITTNNSLKNWPLSFLQRVKRSSYPFFSFTDISLRSTLSRCR